MSGTFSTSFGTTFKGSEYAVACENGSVTILRSKVLVETNGTVDEKNFDEEGSGVKQEVAAWAKSIKAGRANELQSPAQALADLEILQKMLESGASKGKTEALKFQT